MGLWKYVSESNTGRPSSAPRRLAVDVHPDPGPPLIRMRIFLHNVKEHATLSAGAHFDHGVEVETTDDHANRAADGVAVSRLLRSSISGNGVSFVNSDHFKLCFFTHAL